MFNKLNTVYHTVKHLKFKQILYQLKYRLVRPRTLNSYGSKNQVPSSHGLDFIVLPEIEPCWDGETYFSFLNVGVDFKGGVNWNFQNHGKLWNYNLQYANYLSQPGISDVAKMRLMKSQYEWLSDGRLSLEPYPASLRCISMMRWMSANAIDDTELLKHLYADLTFLSTRLEYHLLGNHLLENAFALTMGGAFFSNHAWIRTGKKILAEELVEQILPDGAHFELSPMYHQIILFRLLELIDWYSKWNKRQKDFEMVLRNKASDMLSWLVNISFNNGDIPHFNDSANGIAYSTTWLSEYALKLGIATNSMPLGESGYRSLAQGDLEVKIDFSQIGPAYQPGHAHADALSFIAYYKKEPLFVEQGTSTYQIGPRRNLERSTQAHNTVVVNEANQSEVWGGFRVARRAQTTILRDGNNGVYEAKHDGYKRFGIEHIRSLEYRDYAIVIEDRLSKMANAVSYLHLCPKVVIREVRPDAILLGNGIQVVFEGADGVLVDDYSYADRYHIYHPAKRIVIPFKKRLKSSIFLLNSNEENPLSHILL